MGFFYFSFFLLEMEDLTAVYNLIGCCMNMSSSNPKETLLLIMPKRRVNRHLSLE